MLDQILWIYGINVIVMQWGESVGYVPLELEDSKQKSEIKEFEVFDISSLKDEAEILDDELLQAAEFPLVNPISISLNMFLSDMVLTCEEVGNLDTTFKCEIKIANAEPVLITLAFQNFHETGEFTQTENFTTVDRGYLYGDSVAAVSEPTVGTASVEEIKKHLIYTHYVTSGVFGYANQAVEVSKNLILTGNNVHVVTGAPDLVFTLEVQFPRLFLPNVLLNRAATQDDASKVDHLASLVKYSEIIVVPCTAFLAIEVEGLKSIKANFMVSDVVSVACQVAFDVGIPSLCVTNISWDFIYVEYVAAATDHHNSTWQISRDNSHCTFLIRLLRYCPILVFQDVIVAPWVARRLYRCCKEVRNELGSGKDVHPVILNLGGQLAVWKF